MPNIKIRWDYDQLSQMTSKFTAQGSAIAGMNRKVKAAQSTLEGGDWIGQGAKAFFQEMNSEVNPSLKRLEKAMEEAARITKQIHQQVHQAEDDSSKILITISFSSAPTGPGSGDEIPG
jgi:WXG100 family type VII secretion target